MEWSWHELLLGVYQESGGALHVEESEHQEADDPDGRFTSADDYAHIHDTHVTDEERELLQTEYHTESTKTENYVCVYTTL